MKKLIARVLTLTLAVMLLVPCFAMAGTVAVDSKDYTSGILRSKPGFNGEILAYLKNGTDIEMEVLEETENWYKVTTADGLEGYMHKSVVSEADADTDMITLNQAANLRAEESSDSEYLRGMDEGEELLLLERGRNWSRVIWRGVVGYIHNTVYDWAE